MSAVTELAYDIRVSAVRAALREASTDAKLAIKVEASLKTGRVPRELYESHPSIADFVDLALELKELLVRAPCAE